MNDMNDIWYLDIVCTFGIQFSVFSVEENKLDYLKREKEVRANQQRYPLPQAQYQ